MYYFAKTGGYGDRASMTDTTEWQMIIPTSHWTQAMWALIQACAPKDRYALATHFSLNIHDITSGECSDCELDPDDLTGQYCFDKTTRPEYTYTYTEGDDE